MSESKIKRLWKNRISQQLNSFHIPTCIVPTNQVDLQDEDLKDTPTLSTATTDTLPPSPPLSQHTISSTEKKLWRKPLPNDCPSFDFQISEKTMVEESSISIVEKTEIPTRIQSRHYENIPNLEAQLERACKNEKAVLLTKLLEKQRYSRQCT